MRSEEIPRCRICVKDFPSMKALYGHMRSHPNRPWKGIQPPTPATTYGSSSTSSSATSGGSPVVDSSMSLPCWSVTAKRGCSAKRARKSTASSVSEAVNDLTFFSKSAANSDDDDLNMGELCNSQIGQKLKNNNLMIPTKQQQQEVGRKKKISRVKKIKEIGNQLKTLASVYQIQLPNMISSKKLYKCSSCNKEFSSHQALGGHASSHNKTNNKTTQLLDLSNEAGQRRRIMDFDLNKLPPMDDDNGEGIDCRFGYQRY